jgi:hypothetical protein
MMTDEYHGDEWELEHDRREQEQENDTDDDC